MIFIAISNYLRVLIFAILLSFAEIAEINTRENIICHLKVHVSVVVLIVTNILSHALT